jgi:hypothetical protein
MMPSDLGPEKPSQPLTSITADLSQSHTRLLMMQTTNGDLRSKAGAIKLVMDIESKRIEMLQKAGLLENKELAEEMMEIERKQDILKQILMDIASRASRDQRQDYEETI